MRILKGLILAGVTALCSCASIPLSTAISFSALSPSRLAQIDPEQVRVKLAVPDGYELNVAASHLTLALNGSSGARSAAMDLKLLSTTREMRSGGLFCEDVPVSSYLLSLSPEGARQLRGLQQFVLSGEPNKFKFSVEAPFAKIPPGAQEIRFWADLALTLNEPFMPLFNGAKIRIKNSPASS